jgi:hypothetical protein
MNLIGTVLVTFFAYFIGYHGFELVMILFASMASLTLVSINGKLNRK